MISAWFLAAKLAAKGLPWKLIGIVAAVAALFGMGYHFGSGSVQAAWDADKAKQSKAVAVVQTKQTEVSEHSEAKQVATQVQLHTVFKDRIIYINNGVSNETIARQDSACVIPNRVVSLWNSANRGEVPSPASLADDSASDVVLSDISAQKDRETEASLSNESRLTALQQWVREQQDLTNGEQP